MEIGIVSYRTDAFLEQIFCSHSLGSSSQRTHNFLIMSTAVFLQIPISSFVIQNLRLNQSQLLQNLRLIFQELEDLVVSYICYEELTIKGQVMVMMCRFIVAKHC